MLPLTGLTSELWLCHTRAVPAALPSQTHWSAHHCTATIRPPIQQLASHEISDFSSAPPPSNRASEQKHINVTEHLNGSFPQQLDLDLYLSVYAGLTAASVVFGFLRSLLFFNILVSSAQTLHNTMFNAILRTPVHFFDINPI
ncbi:multidrug resistance-associated protein 4-like protein, partial [Lates japonicus]